MSAHKPLEGVKEVVEQASFVAAPPTAGRMMQKWERM